MEGPIEDSGICDGEARGPLSGLCSLPKDCRTRGARIASRCDRVCRRFADSSRVLWKTPQNRVIPCDKRCSIAAPWRKESSCNCWQDFWDSNQFVTVSYGDYRRALNYKCSCLACDLGIPRLPRVNVAKWLGLLFLAPVVSHSGVLSLAAFHFCGLIAVFP